MKVVSCFGACAGLVLVVAAALPLLLSEMVAGWTVAYRSSFNLADLPSLTGKIIVMTGASKGIGRTASVMLAQKGAKIFVHARSQAGAGPVVKEIQELGGQAEALIGDLQDLKDVKAMADELLKQRLKVDVLVCNAGVAKDTSGKTDAGFELTKDGFELHIQVNHIAHQLLVEKLIDGGALDRSTSRLVVITSALEGSPLAYPEGVRYENWKQKGTNYTDGAAYSQSKLANIMMAHEVQARHGIKSISLHPGIIQTELGRLREKNLWSGIEYLKLNLFLLACMSPEQGAWTTVWAAAAPNVGTGFYHPVGRLVKPTHGAFSISSSAKCWDKTHELLEAYL